jgi:hypothetical protein
MAQDLRQLRGSPGAVAALADVVDELLLVPQRSTRPDS